MTNIDERISNFLNKEFLDPPQEDKVEKKNFCSVFTERHYSNRRILRKIGSKERRIIQIPDPELKILQQQVLLDLQSKIKIHKNAYGLNNQDFKANALRHKENKEILCIDLKDFYQTINLDMVLNDPTLSKYYWLYIITTNNPLVYNYISTATCIPTGSPLSPIVSTIIMKSIDEYLSSEIEEIGGIYTRYFDDITVSFKEKLTSFERSEVFYKISNTIKFSGFSLNWAKSKWLDFNNHKVKITGVDIRSTPKVNNSHIRNSLRPKINNMFVHAFSFYSLATNKNELLKLIRLKDEELAGYLAYIEHVNKDQFNSVLDYALKRLNYIKSLNQTN
jgi:hypothetical protein